MMLQRALAFGLVGLMAISSASQAAAPSQLLIPSAPGVPSEALAAGGLRVHLDNFIELRDGRVQADVSVFNPNISPAAFMAQTQTPAGDANTFVETVDRLSAGLTNGDGQKYRLIALSQFGDTLTRAGWITVPAGSAAFLTATFAPDGARRGVQPFALSLPLRTAWQDGIDPAERGGTFAVNFRGLRRATEEARDVPRAAPVPRVQEVALPSVPVNLVPAPPKAAAAPESFKDDVAPLIAKLPKTTPDSRRYLIAIGVDAYDEAPAVPFADRSARAMSDLLRKVYGVPEENVTLITGADATGTKISGRLNSLLHRLTPGDTVFFYYAGHGFSARDGKAVYIVPRDAVPGAYEVEALSLASLLERFEASPAGRVVAFLDTCFSGRVSRDTSLFAGTAPLVPVPVEPTAIHATNKVSVFLAGQGTQFANDYPERGHRLFSYYLMHGILKGYASAKDLSTFVAREVRRVSAKRGSEFVQEPRLEGVAQSLPARLVKLPKPEPLAH